MHCLQGMWYPFLAGAEQSLERCSEGRAKARKEVSLKNSINLETSNVDKRIFNVQAVRAGTF